MASWACDVVVGAFCFLYFSAFVAFYYGFRLGRLFLGCCYVRGIFVLRFPRFPNEKVFFKMLYVIFNYFQCNELVLFGCFVTVLYEPSSEKVKELVGKPILDVVFEVLVWL